MHKRTCIWSIGWCRLPEYVIFTYGRPAITQFRGQEETSTDGSRWARSGRHCAGHRLQALSLFPLGKAVRKFNQHVKTRKKYKSLRAKQQHGESVHQEAFPGKSCSILEATPLPNPYRPSSHLSPKHTRLSDHSRSACASVSWVTLWASAAQFNSSPGGV